MPRADVTVESVMDKIQAAIEAESDRSWNFGMHGGDDGITDEMRQKWNAAPSLEDIKRDIETLAGVHAEPWDA